MIENTGCIAFPQNFRIIKRTVRSTVNSSLTTCLFSYNGMEYSADSHSGIILREIGWRSMSRPDKERISIYWVDQLMHLNGILFTKYSNLDENELSDFSSPNIFKPSFSEPEYSFNKKGDLTIKYWQKDLREKTVKRYEITIDENGDTKSRSVISTKDGQLYKGIGITVVLSVVVALIFKVDKKNLPQYWKSISSFLNLHYTNFFLRK
eukprot:gene3759-4679_t